ncbi:hypothetical protein C8J57DRAFT_1330978 [Mycena rebaudengoi]|nr:hypothetical protein C8J57DRAFT_1330978 [Mycena rebaudengoi]
MWCRPTLHFGDSTLVFLFVHSSTAPQSQKKMQKEDEYDSSHPKARHSRFWTGSKPVIYFGFAILFAYLHHWMNSSLDGKAIDAVPIASINIDVPYIHRKINLSQKEQHWVLGLFAFLWKSSITRSMSCGLTQHAWKSLRTTDLNVRQIDCVVALQHRKPSGLRSLTVIVRCFPTVILALLSIGVPYSAILPAGSLTVDVTDDTGVYVYNSHWLVLPYCLGLGVTALTIAYGTHIHYKHNTNDRSFSFSHIVAATRVVFDDALQNVNRHHIPHKVMQDCGKLRFEIQDGTETFVKQDQAAEDVGFCGCFGGSDD